MDLIIYTSLHVPGKSYLALLTILAILRMFLKQRIGWVDIFTGERPVNSIEIYCCFLNFTSLK